MSAVPPLIPGSQVYSTLEVDTAKINTLIGNVLYKLNSWKGTVDVATVSGNTALVGLYSIDGFTVIKGSRVLVRGQTDPIQNGIYVADLAAWKRSSDLPVGSHASGVAVFTVNGSVNFDRVFVCVTNEVADLVGTDPLVFEELLASSSSVGSTVGQIQVSGGVDVPVIASLATALANGVISTPASITAGTSLTGATVSSTTTMSAGSTVTAGTSITAGTSVSGASVAATAGNVTATGNVSAVGTVTAGGLMTAGTTITAGGVVTGTGHVVSGKTTQTQPTSNVTAVPITASAGTITSNGALGNGAGATITYKLTGTTTLLPVGALVMTNVSAYAGTAGGVPMVLVAAVTVAGEADVVIRNVGTVALDSALTYKFMVV